MNVLQLIDNIKSFNVFWIKRHSHFLINDFYVKTGAEYLRSVAKSKIDIGFNLFTIISNTYHQENFHSDILKVFLESNSHNEGNKYLYLFLEYLNELGSNINLSNYSNPIIFREKGKIDLLILDKISNRGIIVENKINNAPDMHRQLPRYVEHLKNKGLVCDSIVYISLNKIKMPATNGWSKDEIEFIKSKIVYSIAYYNSNKDLYNGWIAKSEKITNNIDALLILRQYGALLKKLGGNIMNKVIVEKFYEEMLVVENFKTAQSIKSMLGELILFRAEKIAEHFKSDLMPFRNISVWNSYVVAFLDYLVEGHHWSIDIGVHENEYQLDFWDRNNPDPSGAKQLLQNINMFDDNFYESSNRVKRHFKFPEQEKELIDYVTSFKNKLQGK